MSVDLACTNNYYGILIVIFYFLSSFYIYKLELFHRGNLFPLFYLVIYVWVDLSKHYLYQYGLMDTYYFSLGYNWIIYFLNIIYLFKLFQLQLLAAQPMQALENTTILFSSLNRLSSWNYYVEIFELPLPLYLL